ncbi:MAG: hypothetical protein ACRD02_11930 [Acidimicrobiia bacterium]
MSTVSRPASEHLSLREHLPLGEHLSLPLRGRVGEGASRLLLAGFLALAPSRVPPWRLDPAPRAAAVLAVGDPTRSLWVGRG